MLAAPPHVPRARRGRNDGRSQMRGGRWVRAQQGRARKSLTEALSKPWSTLPQGQLYQAVVFQLNTGHGRIEHIRRSKEAHDGLGGRPLVDLLRRTGLQYLSMLHPDRDTRRTRTISLILIRNTNRGGVPTIGTR